MFRFRGSDSVVRRREIMNESDVSVVEEATEDLKIYDVSMSKSEGYGVE